MSSVRILFILGILVVFTHSALSIKCYRCESDNVESCGEDFDAEGTFLEDCSKIPPPRHLMHILGTYKNATGCAKVVAERYGRPVIIRSCYFGDINDTKRGCTSNPADISLVYTTCEVCTHDSCNGSSMARPIAFLVILLISVARLFTK